MNIQALMKQAQKMQKDMMQSKEEIDKMEFSSETSFVKITATGDKKINSVKIDKDMLDSDDIEILEDLLQVTMNDVLCKIEKVTEEKMGKYAQGMPGLF
ncbi:MAG: YbaB/EbfC family nucleoid-associated protein [Bacilli bacterium]